MSSGSAKGRIGIGLTVAAPLVRFVEDELLTDTEISAAQFWDGLSDLVDEFAPRIRQVLERRDELQTMIDEWHSAHPGRVEPIAYERFLRDIGYIVPEAAPTKVATAGVDPEVGAVAGPQLVVPVTNARYALNAANARWGSLYDALYGTDALGDAPPSGPYDPARGARVVKWARRFLDVAAPLEYGSHGDVVAYRVEDGRLVADLGTRRTTLTAVAELAGYRGEPGAPTAIVVRHHGLHVEVVIDRSHSVGATDPAGVADVVVEAAITTIVDLEDSVAVVDADDKVAAYRNWLGLMRGDLREVVSKDGRSFARALNPDRIATAPDGSELRLPGRALLMVRNVGHHMTTSAVRDQHGQETPEGLLDALVTVAACLHDLRRPAASRNSRSGSVYVVKPKLHGPEEVRLAVDVFAAVERILGLPERTVKLGIMDEERRTTVNLAACVAEAAERVAFINTGFLDRTGDEIHTSMEAGPVVRKNDMRGARWIHAYEAANVDVGIRCGLPGRGQIGKGMWPKPDHMHAMLQAKIEHPRAGASCAWVPSPSAATLHATHYHDVDVAARQAELAGHVTLRAADLLVPPLAEAPWTDAEVQAELDNNLQGILGYVVRWVDQGVGCSKVPDIDGVALMEDRATCRISAQHVANWLRHGVVTVDRIEATLRKMAVIVDRQNAADTAYASMAPHFAGPAFAAARDLVLLGARQPSGYTEPILHRYRLMAKAANRAPIREQIGAAK